MPEVDNEGEYWNIGNLPVLRRRMSFTNEMINKPEG